MRRLCALVLAVSTMLGGCFLVTKQAVSLYTDHAEFAAYVELYNSAQTEYKVELGYAEAPFRILEESSVVPDLIIGKWLANEPLLQGFDTLDGLLTSQKISRESFYPDLLALGAHEQEVHLLPVSFNLPAVVLDVDLAQETDNPIVIGLEEMRTLSERFNQKKGEMTNVGFSPLWDADFLYYIGRLFGAQFRAAEDQVLAWNDLELQRSVDFVRAWIDEINDGIEVERRFIGKYFTVPPYTLVADGRIMFYLASSAGFAALSEEKRAVLDFRWLSHEKKIPVQEGILWTGIPLAARNKEGAKSFLVWLFSQETQRRLLEVNSHKRLRVFGIANGFSALPEINERDLPEQHAFFLGHIPGAGFLQFPPRLPTEWERLKREVVQQRYFEHIVEGTDVSLEVLVESWIRQNVR